MRAKQILVIGSSDEIKHHDEAYRIGEFIASNGWTLLNGGRGGVMESVSRGAFDAGGTVVDILPGNGFSEANRYCTIVIPTGIGFARNAVNVLAADIIVAVGGKAGTLSELAYAWIYGKPVICCTFAEGWSTLFPDITVDDRNGSVLYRAESVDEVCDLLRSLCSE